MNLDKYTKKSIVRAIMAELPRVDEAKVEQEIIAKCVAAMSPECQSVYLKTPDAIAKTGVYDTCSRYSFKAPKGDLTDDQFAEIIKPYQEAHRERRNIESKLDAALVPIRTRKQFINRFPEFSQHAPPEEGTCATLPAIANIVADLVKLGWEPKVTKTEGETS